MTKRGVTCRCHLRCTQCLLRVHQHLPTAIHRHPTSPPAPRFPRYFSLTRFRSPGTTPQGAGTGNKLLSATYSPSTGGGGIKGRGGGSGRTTPSSLSPPTKTRRSQTQSPGSGPAGAEVGGSAAGGDEPVRAGTWAPGSMFGGGGHGRSRSRGSDGGTAETALSPPRPLVGARAGKQPAEGLEEAEEAPVSPGPSGAALARRFFFGGTETVRSFASSLSPPQPQPPEKKSAAGPSTLPSSPHGLPAAAPALGRLKSVSSSGSIGGEGKGWAEMVSGGKGELPSLLAPVELHGRDGEGATHHVRAGIGRLRGDERFCCALVFWFLFLLSYLVAGKDGMLLLPYWLRLLVPSRVRPRRASLPTPSHPPCAPVPPPPPSTTWYADTRVPSSVWRPLSREPAPVQPTAR